MKKSQLKNIIRESIKQLLTEQAVATNVPCCAVGASACNPGSGPGNPQAAIQHMFYQWPNGTCPAVGDIIQVQGTIYNQTTPWNNGAPQNFTVTSVSVIPPTTYWGWTSYACMQAQWSANPATSSPTIYGLTMTPISSCGTSIVAGCTDSSAFNYNSNATYDDGSCDYGWRCKDTWPQKPGIGMKCVHGNQNNPGTFATKQDCLSSGCEPLPADVDKDLEIGPAGPQTTPPTIPSVTSKRAEPDAEILRLKKLADIK